MGGSNVALGVASSVAKELKNSGLLLDDRNGEPKKTVSTAGLC
jgi:hypothetical protein